MGARDHIAETYGCEMWELLGEEERSDIVVRLVEGFRRLLAVAVLLSGLSQGNLRGSAQLEHEATEAVADMVYALNPERLRFALKSLPLRHSSMRPMAEVRTT